MSEDLDARVRAMLAGRAAVPLASGDPVGLVTARMGRRRRRAFIVAGAAACTALAAAAVVAAVVLPHPGSRRSIATSDAGSAASGPAAATYPVALTGPQALAVDRAGNLLISDASYRILRLEPDGTLAVVAGLGYPGFSGDGGPATHAGLNAPGAIAVATDGTIYVADTGNNRVRAISPKGVIRTVVGNGVAGAGGEGQRGVDAAVQPNALAVSSSGELYFASGGNLDRLAADGTVHVVIAASIDGATPTSNPQFPASFSPQAFDPTVLAFDKAGDLYIASFGTKALLRLTGDRLDLVATVYITGGGLATAADGSVLVGDHGAYGVDRVVGDNLAPLVSFTKQPIPHVDGAVRPGPLAQAPDGAIFVADDGELGTPLIVAQEPGGPWTIALAAVAPAVSLPQRSPDAIRSAAVSSVANGPACSEQNLQVSQHGGQIAGMGGTTVAIVFRNTGSQPCSLIGWPTIATPGLNTTVQYQTVTGAGFVVPVARVVIEPGQAAATALDLFGAPGNNYGGAECAKPGAWAVTPPGGDHPVTVAWLANSGACNGGTVLVSPVYPGAEPEVGFGSADPATIPALGPFSIPPAFR